MSQSVRVGIHMIESYSCIHICTVFSLEMPNLAWAQGSFSKTVSTCSLQTSRKQKVHNRRGKRQNPFEHFKTLKILSSSES